MDKEKEKVLEIYHMPDLRLLDAFTGPDALHPTHQAFVTFLRLRQGQVISFFRHPQEHLRLSFCNPHGVSIYTQVMRIEVLSNELSNPDIVNVKITGVISLDDLSSLNSDFSPDLFGY